MFPLKIFNLARKGLKTRNSLKYRYVLVSIVIADTPVLKHQPISIHNAYLVSNVVD